MTRTAIAVIGALHGDEGKGAATDLFAASVCGPVTVVRTNGGAQAGHTVVSEGRRHVFHHVGSGTFAGASTHLAGRFVSHPMFLAGELADLAALDSHPCISADPRGWVTTPWDVMANQIAEDRRSGGRHGSCGMGFGETVGRCETTPWRLAVSDLASPDLADRLRGIRDGWMRTRLHAVEADVLSGEEERAVADDGILERFLEDCRFFRERVEIRPDSTVRGHAVLEGAQGLLLDQDYGTFPYVTRSHTGIRNMLAFAGESGIGSIEAFYAFRPYATRHGAGPLAHGGEAVEGVAFEDRTNVPNSWQGNMRIAPLDTDVLLAAIRHDLSTVAKGDSAIRCSIAVSCLDQISEGFSWRSGGLVRRGSPEALTEEVRSALDACGVMSAYGPDRQDRRICRDRMGSFGLCCI